MAQRTLEQLTREHRGDRDAGKVVVRERGVADVGRHDHIALVRALDRELGVGEMARLERRVDHHLVVARLQRQELAVREAEAPGAAVVRRPIWDDVGLIGQRVEPLAQRLQRERSSHRLAVGDDVEIRLAKVDDTSAVGRRDVGVADVPLVRDDPIEHTRAARNLGPADRDLLGEHVEGRPYAGAGRAAAEREEALHQRVGVTADGVGPPSRCDGVVISDASILAHATPRASELPPQKMTTFRCTSGIGTTQRAPHSRV